MKGFYQEWKVFLENGDFAGVVTGKLQYLEMRLLDFRSKT
jgi:hypothetical protein